ncbi:MAG: hypothetical protein HRT69_12820 [Flavobacteriaceae bacterium]|nr:hypothetical protein [Flavobacteriaceae bacterium]
MNNDKDNKNAQTKPELYTVLATAIINNNFAVQSVFDDVSEGLCSEKHLSEKEANKLHKNKKTSYQTNYGVVKCLAIVGIVPFNKHLAYVFNKQLPNSESSDNISITSGEYEELMDCYVYRSSRISENQLEKLEKEYYKRGGVVYPNYRSFEDLILRKVRKYRNNEFINGIVFDSIFKHGFREVGKKKWSNGEITIRRKQIQCSSISYPSHLKHTELNTSFKNMTLIGSIFGKDYTHINQLKEDVFGVICSTKNSSSYNFGYFEVCLGCS